MLGRPDARVCLPVAVGLRGLSRRPFPDAADIHRDAENLLGADHDAVRPVCLDTADAILEGRWDLHLVLGAGKWAVREQRRLADAVPGLPDTVVLNPDRLAWVGLAAHCLAEQQVAAAAQALYKQDAGRSAA